MNTEFQPGQTYLIDSINKFGKLVLHQITIPPCPNCHAFGYTMFGGIIGVVLGVCIAMAYRDYCEEYASKEIKKQQEHDYADHTGV